MRVKFLVDKVIDGKEYFWGMQYEYDLFDEKILVEFEKENEIKIIGKEVIEKIKEELKDESKEVKKKRKTKKEVI